MGAAKESAVNREGEGRVGRVNDLLHPWQNVFDPPPNIDVLQIQKTFKTTLQEVIVTDVK